MIKRPCPSAVNVNSPGQRSESGVRPIAPSTDTDNPMGVGGYTWGQMEAMVRRMAFDDPRRRLLDLACMRRDRALAIAVLRQPVPSRRAR